MIRKNPIEETSLAVSQTARDMDESIQSIKRSKYKINKLLDEMEKLQREILKLKF